MIKNGWYYCQHCGRKLFPVSSRTVVRHLELQCRRCKAKQNIEIEPEPSSHEPKPIQN